MPRTRRRLGLTVQQTVGQHRGLARSWTPEGKRGAPGLSSTASGNVFEAVNLADRHMHPRPITRYDSTPPTSPADRHVKAHWRPAAQPHLDVPRGELPTDTDAREVIRAVSAPLYYRMLASGDPLDETAADRAAAAAGAYPATTSNDHPQRRPSKGNPNA